MLGTVYQLAFGLVISDAHTRAIFPRPLLVHYQFIGIRPPRAGDGIAEPLVGTSHK